MVAYVVLVDHGALCLGQGASDYGQAASGGVEVAGVEAGSAALGELPGHGFLFGSEDGDRELSACEEGVSGAGVEVQGDHQDGWVQADGRQRVDGHAVLFTGVLRGDHGDTCEEPAHGAAHCQPVGDCEGCWSAHQLFPFW